MSTKQDNKTLIISFEIQDSLKNFLFLRSGAYLREIVGLKIDSYRYYYLYVFILIIPSFAFCGFIFASSIWPGKKSTAKPGEHYSSY